MLKISAHQASQIISKSKIFAVIRENNKDKAIKSVQALLDGGIKLIEFSMLSPIALELIEYFNKKGVFVGAGTVMNKSMATELIRGGCHFIISPHIEEEVIELALDNDIFVASGCVTPTEIIKAHRLGVHLIKIFPAHGFGGVPYLKSLIDIFPDISFMPTGGVSKNNIEAYFQQGVMAVGMSTAILKKQMIELGQYNQIKELAKYFNSLVKKE